MRKNLLPIIILLAVICADFAFAGSSGMELNMQVEGNAPVINNDEAGARDAAVKNALANAILRAADRILTEKYENEKFKSVKSNLIGKADRYVKSYRLTSETRQLDSYNISLNVVMALTPLRDDLWQMGVVRDQGGKDLNEVVLSFYDVPKYSDFLSLKIFLQKYPKIVKSIYPCQLEWRKVSFNLIVGSMRDLAGELEKTGRYLVEIQRENKGVAKIILRVKKEAL